jgi:catechol 2,3-dioxygenase-like lactoylglutathione lyase family enzyme
VFLPYEHCQPQGWRAEKLVFGADATVCFDQLVNGNTFAQLTSKEQRMTSRIATVTLVVEDYDAAIAFYRDAMRFSVFSDTDLGGGKRWVVVGPEAGGARLLLAKADGETQRSAIGRQTGGRVGFFLETDDFSGQHQHMLAAGVRFLEAPRHERYGTVAVFEDLYGNRWDLIEPAEPGPGASR